MTKGFFLFSLYSILLPEVMWEAVNCQYIINDVEYFYALAEYTLHEK